MMSPRTKTVLRWIACFPAGLAVFVVGNYIVKSLLVAWLHLDDGGVWNFLPDYLTAAIGNTIVGLCVGALAIVTATRTAPNNRQLVAGIMVGVLTVFLILAVICLVAARQWWHIPECVGLGVGAFWCAISEAGHAPPKAANET